jgi:hypothetical protein
MCALQATFTGNWKQWDESVENAKKNMVAFEMDVKGVQREMQRMVSSFDGSRIIREATLMSAAVEKIGGATKLTEAETKRYNAAISEAVAKMQALGQEAPEAWKKIAAETEKAAKASEGVGAGNKKAGESMLSLGSIAKGVGGAIAASFTVGAITSLVTDVINLGGEVSDLASRTGISTDAIQELKYAADQTGSSIDTVVGSIEKMGIKLTEASDDTLRSVRDLGLSIDDLRGMRPEDAYTAIADAVAGIENPMRQVEVATELMGRAAAQNLPAIKAGLSDLRQEARDLGQVMSKDAIEGLDTLGDTWGKIVGAVKAGVGEIIADLARATDGIRKMQAELAKESAKGQPSRSPISQRLDFGERSVAEAKREAEKIQKVLDGVKGPKIFGPEFAKNSTGGFVPDTPSFEEQERASRAQMAAVEASVKHAQAIKSLADAWRAADLTKQIQLQAQAFASLTPAEKANADITKKLVEEYGKLRTQVGPGALPRDLEAFYRAHLPVIRSSEDLGTVISRLSTTRLPDLSKRTQETTALLAGFRRDGLIPVTESFEKLSATNMIPWPVDGIVNAGSKITAVKDIAVTTVNTLDGLARSLSQLNSISPLDGPLKQFAELINLMNVGQQFGEQIAGAFRSPKRDSLGNIQKDAQGNIQYQRFSLDNFKGKNGTESQVGAYMAIAQIGLAAAQGSTPVLQATNIRGRGSRALAGAAAGAAEGGAVGGPYGAAGGAIFGAIIGAVRNPAFEDIMNRVSKDMGIEMSEEMAKGIEEVAKKKFGKDRQAAEIFSLGDILQEAGGVTDKNAVAATGKLRDVFVMLETGKFTAEEATQALDSAFGAFAEHLRKSEGIASKSFQEIIKLNTQMGTNSKAIKEFVEGQAAVLGGSIANLAAPLVEKFGGLADSIKAAKDEVDTLTSSGRQGTDEYALAVKNLTDLQMLQKDAAISATDEFERLGVIALGAFNAAVDAGADWLTAVENMGPALDTLLGLQKDLGIESTNAGLAELVRFRDLVNNNQALVLSTQALNDTMKALSSIGGLNIDTLAAMEAQGLQTFQRLIDAGFTENQALRQMKGFLLNVISAHEQLGVPIDENTQKLIDMAQEQGLLKDSGQDMAKIMKDGFQGMKDGVDKLVGSLGLVAQGLGQKVPEAVQDAIDALEKIPREIDVGVNVNYNDPGFDPGGGSYNPNGGDYPSFANGGVGDFGSGTLAMLHGREAIIPLDRMGGGRGGGPSTIHVHLEAEGREFAHAVVPYIPDVLAFHGVAR